MFNKVEHTLGRSDEESLKVESKSLHCTFYAHGEWIFIKSRACGSCMITWQMFQAVKDMIISRFDCLEYAAAKDAFFGTTLLPETERALTLIDSAFLKLGSETFDILKAWPSAVSSSVCHLKDVFLLQ